MKLFFLACLLAVLPVVSMKSPIFGPREMSRMEGSSASITCYYPDASVNRHSRKYWCKQGAKGRCTTLISDSYVSKGYEGRASITNYPENNTFVVNIGHLTQSDSGSYKCGLGIINEGLSFDVSLEVLPGPGLLNGTQVYTGKLGKTVTIKCPFKPENVMEVKYVFRELDGAETYLVTDTNGYVSDDYKDRVEISIMGTSQLEFNFIIKQLQLSDAGKYVCQAGPKNKNDRSNVDLHVLKPEPQLLYGDLRGSVIFYCALGPGEETLTKFLCRMSKGKACEVVVNTQGKMAEAFEGRILIAPVDKTFFKVHIADLRKEDAGSYLCGAHATGGPQEGLSMQPWQLFINEDTRIPRSPSVVKGVVGGSVAMLCPYNPKDTNSQKHWCRWDKENSGCTLLVSSEGLDEKQYEPYEGRLTLHEEPGNGSYTVILNQLTAQDAGFYWCLTSGDTRWWFPVELKIVEGEPNLEAPKEATAWLGETLNLPCHSPCKFYSYEKYWCKWSNEGCKALPSQQEGSRQASVNCDPNNQLTSLILNPVTKDDEGWYWCGVKNGPRFGDTTAVHVAVKERAKASQDVSQLNVAPGKQTIEARAKNTEDIIQGPRLFAEDVAGKDDGDLGDRSKALVDPGSSAGQGGSSTVLVSTLVPLALVLALGALAVAVVRARHRRNVDRVSIGSYRTDFSMSDLESSRDFGANDNMGVSSVVQETSLGGKDELSATAEDTKDTDEPKKAKRSSKEEADMAHTAFLLQANQMVTSVQDGPSEA